MNRQELLDRVRERYSVEPDYPWNDGNAVLRHGSNRKWFALVMQVTPRVLGLPGEVPLDILNIKCPPTLIGALRSQPGFLPAYHMNKDQWITILLDGSVEADQIMSLVDLSYDLTGVKRRPKTK